MTGSTAVAHDDAPAAAPDMLHRDHFALVIGIQNYREFEPLAAPNRDAMRFCRWLTDVAKVPKENIQPVLGERDGTPTNSDILTALDNLGLRLRKWKGSRLYIYFAGHGIGPKVNEVALLPADARIDALHHQVFGTAEMIDHLFRTRYFNELVVFLDCCREAQEVTPLGLPYRPLDPVEGAPTDASPRYSVLVGSNLDGRSFELGGAPANPGAAEAYRGLMTEALLEGLNGAYGAIDPKLNAVTTTSLEHYVSSKVAERAKAQNLQQQASLLLRTGDPIVLLQLETVPELTLQIVVGPASAGKRIRIRNLRTSIWRDLGTAAAGEQLPDVILDTNTRHLLTDGDQVMEVLDPVTMENPHVLRLA